MNDFAATEVAPFVLRADRDGVATLTLNRADSINSLSLGMIDALKSEELLAGNKSGYADTAYAAGLIFDLLVLMAVDLSEEPKRVISYVDNVFSHGLRAAMVGVELGKSVPEFSHGKFVFSACLVHDIGKIVMAILDKTYLDVLEDCSKKALPRAVRQFAEEKRFGVNHAVLGGIACHYFQLFRQIEKAIYFHHDPYVLRANKGLYQLCAIVCLSTNIANSFKKVEKVDDPLLGVWKGVDLRDFRMDSKTMMDAVKKVV